MPVAVQRRWLDRRHPPDAAGRGRRRPARAARRAADGGPRPRVGRRHGPNGPLPARGRLHDRLGRARTGRWPPTWRRRAAPPCTVPGLPARPRAPVPRGARRHPRRLPGAAGHGARPGPDGRSPATRPAAGWRSPRPCGCGTTGARRPAALGLVSPWLDLTRHLVAGRPHRRDAAPGLAAAVRAPASPRTPSRPHAEFAPLEADLAGLPPMTVHVGSEEILLDDAVRLARRRPRRRRARWTCAGSTACGTSPTRPPGWCRRRPPR